jgi:type I restriction enzyme, S subunit
MGSEWKADQLISRGLLDVGDGYRAKNSELASEGLPFARAGNLNDGFNFDGADLLNFKAVKLAGAKVSQVGDVVFTSKGTVGRFAYVSSNVPTFVYSPQLCYWRSKDQNFLDSKYLYYWMQSKEFVQQMSSVKGQTDMAEYVSLRDQRQFKINLPPLETQRRIASILSAFDDKIELNRRMNRTLEAMARALFKSWFVDFDPVRAKMRGEEPVGIDAGTAALFPDMLLEVDGQEVPKGWELSTVKSEVQRISVGNKYDQKSVFLSGKVPVLDQGKNGVIGYHDDLPSILASKESPVIVFANHTCYMRMINFPFSTIQNVLPFVGKRSNIFWLYYSTEGIIKFSEYKGHWPEFESKSIIYPGKDVTEAFGSHVGELLDLSWRNDTESAHLEQLRDAVLPRLLSGEIDLQDLEEQA